MRLNNWQDPPVEAAPVVEVVHVEPVRVVKIAKKDEKMPEPKPVEVEVVNDEDENAFDPDKLSTKVILVNPVNQVNDLFLIVLHPGKSLRLTV